VFLYLRDAAICGSWATFDGATGIIERPAKTQAPSSIWDHSGHPRTPAAYTAYAPYA
jgi:hypothetical protein